VSRWTSARLEEFFAPRSVAIVGASERSAWVPYVLSSLELGEFPGRVELVNGRGGTVFGREAAPRLTDLAEPVDLAFLLLPSASVLPALEDAAAAGVRNAVVLSAGFAEVGSDGAAAQAALARLAHEADLALLGPNTLGFVNAAAAVNLHPSQVPGRTLHGHVSLVAQSGALNSSMLMYCHSHAIGVSKVVSLGNEVVLDAADMVRYLVDDEDTLAIGLFLETIRRPMAFLDALQLARSKGKPVVVLKIGRHEVAARVAAAHTGAFVGDDRMIDAMLRQNAAIRVGSLEELLTTADLLARTGRIAGRRLAVTGISGGACDVIADRATDAGLDLRPFSERTVADLREILTDLAGVNNPLDVTGAALTDTSLLGRVIKTIGESAEADAVVVQYDIPIKDFDHPVFRGLLESAGALDVPALVVGALASEISSVDNPFTGRKGDIYSGGLEQIVAALGRAVWWSSRVQSDDHVPPPSWHAIDVPTSDQVGTWSEARSRALLSSGGVPMVPAVHAPDADAAAEAAHALGFPVVVKANGNDLPHKTDIGGVELDLRTEDDVRAACARIAASVGEGLLDGLLVSPMRGPATELIVGVARTDGWGYALAVGFGGVFTEVWDDTSLRLLPVTDHDVHEMLDELTNSAILDGVRGRPAADREALVAAILAVAGVAMGLGDRLEALEVNPLAVDGSRIEALDALVIWGN
jgi:acyl-CoA synthetase (NDP forming)